MLVVPIFLVRARLFSPVLWEKEGGVLERMFRESFPILRNSLHGHCWFCRQEVGSVWATRRYQEGTPNR